jgi:hypothetical protein
MVACPVNWNADGRQWQQLGFADRRIASADLKIRVIANLI